MGEPSTSHLSSDGQRSMPALTSMGIDRADIRCEGPLVVIASSWTKHRRRWFVSDGYHVAFYKTRELTVRRGRFDLRIVLRIEPSRLAGRDDLGEGAPPGAERLLVEHADPNPSPSPSPNPSPSPSPSPKPPHPPQAGFDEARAGGGRPRGLRGQAWGWG